MFERVKHDPTGAMDAIDVTQVDDTGRSWEFNFGDLEGRGVDIVYSLQFQDPVHDKWTLLRMLLDDTVANNPTGYVTLYMLTLFHHLPPPIEPPAPPVVPPTSSVPLEGSAAW